MDILRRRAGIAAALILGAALAARCGSASTPTGQPSFKPVATVDEIMDAIVVPSSEAIFDAVVYSNGELVSMPKADADWFTLRLHALGVAEAGNLLMMAPRARDGGEWLSMSAAMTDAATVVAKAAAAKDVEALLKAGGDMYATCTACHEKYIPQN